jgi:arylsulfatase A-like enzyme
MKKPNVVFVFADEWRAQATGYAGDANCRTPVLDALAAESIHFTNAVAGSPVCCPYRAGLVTGQYPLTHGVIVNDVELSPDVTSIAHAFNEGGYSTAYIGKWHIYGSPDGHYGRRSAFVPREYQLGFDYWKGFECTHNYNQSHYYFNDDPTRRTWEGYDAFAQSRDAADYIRAHAGGEQPFMLMLSWGPPHFPLFTAPAEYRALYEDKPIDLRPNVPEANRAEAAKCLRGYYAHIAALDDALLTVLDAVRESGAEDDTIFVFTSDHGDMMQSQGLGTKLFPWEESLAVPFLLRYPRLTNRTQREIPAPIDAPDIMPTLLGLCGLETPDSVEGRDFSPIIRGEAEVTGDEAALLVMPVAFTELCQNGMLPYRGLRTARHTYVRHTDGPWLLYDLESDPYQMDNLIGRPEYGALQQRLDARLMQRLKDMGDEFLPGEAYVERYHLQNYKEIYFPAKEKWTDPWRR